MDNETIQIESKIGQRLSQYKKSEKYFLMWEGKKISLVNKITIGRDKTNNIVLNDALVSRDHAVIQKIKNVYYLKDLESTNGTFVNGEQIPAGKYCALEHTDRILIGKSELQLL
jgi:pSer/pThr/pTyr-binding forkhead associated (FHA) protein